MEYLAARAGLFWEYRQDLHSQVAALELGGQKVLLAKPQTYMNRSGRAALALCQLEGISPAEVLVVCDDFYLDFGRLRFRRRGSDGGHNGLSSVLEALATQQVPRLRLGIGQPPPGAEVIDYVLGPFAPDEAVEELVARGAEALAFYCAQGIEAAMNRFNGT
jgi:PTH1 family peptidyl-tRNA hydrolase